METTTHKGERCLIIGNYKYALRYQSSAMWTWRCTTRLCNASVHTRASDTSIFDDASNIQHNHAASVRDSSFEMAKSTCKRKATEDVTCRPSKILRTDGHVNASASITSTDLRSIRQTMYRSRRRTLPALPTFASYMLPVSTDTTLILYLFLTLSK